mmetsp:Transcript_4964/g.15563  ORF Transcript_4964/g.15563 Transcript_4964/m.15563 type:complete len:232 (-) Transcript_4964:97-792(-)
MMRPLTWIPMSNLTTSSRLSTVLSPALGVQCAATWLMLQPVGKAMPRSGKCARTSSRTLSSSFSTMSIMSSPGCAMVLRYFLAVRCTSAASRCSFRMEDICLSDSRISADDERYAFIPMYSQIWPFGKSPFGNKSMGGTVGSGHVCSFTSVAFLAGCSWSLVASGALLASTAIGTGAAVSKRPCSCIVFLTRFSDTVQPLSFSVAHIRFTPNSAWSSLISRTACSSSSAVG